MRWYKILARILLMLSAIDFALAAPVVIQEHEVRVSGVDAAEDRTATWPVRWDSSNKWLVNAPADQTNALPMPRSSDSGHSRKQKPRQHNPGPLTDSSGPPEPSNQGQPVNVDNPPLPSPQPGPGSTSPRPTSQAPTDESDPLNPSSPHGNTDLNPSPHQGQGPTDDTHASNLASPSASRPLSPDPSGDNIDRPESSSQKSTSLSGLMSSTSRIHDTPPALGGSQHIAVSPDRSLQISVSPDRSPQIAASPDGPHSSNSLVSTDSLMSTDSYSGSSSGGFSQQSLPSDRHSSSSGSTTDESHSSSLDQSPIEEPDPTTPSSTDQSHPPTPDNYPPPASPSNPGPSTPEANSPPSAKRPPPEDDEGGSSLSKMLKGLKGGKLKRRFSGSRALNAARDQQGTFNSRA